MKLLRRIKYVAPIVIILCGAGVVFFKAMTHVESFSTAVGNAVGVFTGSIDGITNGLSEGAQQGHEEGLSAKDTQVSMAEEIQEVGKLEVLRAGVGIKNAHSVGEKYDALYIMKGDAILSVDLGKAEISDFPSENKLLIMLPQPDIDLTLNEEETEKLAERQNKIRNGKAEDGFIAYINTMKKTQSEMESVIGNYDSLVEQARNSAVTQLEYIVAQASLNEKEVEIRFVEEGEADE